MKFWYIWRGNKVANYFANLVFFFYRYKKFNFSFYRIGYSASEGIDVTRCTINFKHLNHKDALIHEEQKISRQHKDQLEA